MIRPIEFGIFTDPFHDSSGKLVELARPLRPYYSHALVLRDLKGSGWEGAGEAAFETELRSQLTTIGWNHDNSDVIVTNPEIEDWLRIPSHHLIRLLQRRARRNRHQLSSVSRVREVVARINEKHGGLNEIGKSRNPKDVFSELLMGFGVPRSNELYGYLAQYESLTSCASVSFCRAKTVLTTWFGSPSNDSR